MRRRIRRAPKFAAAASIGLLSLGACVGLGQPDAPPGAPDAPPPTVHEDAPPPPPAPGFVPIGEATPHEDPTDHRALRHTDGGVELYTQQTGQPLRSYLPGRAATAWAHATADRWLVALQGGDVVEVNFATQAVHDIATFDGDVYWLSVDQTPALPVLRMAIADHTVEGVGTFPLLYTIDLETGALRAESIDQRFDAVYEDDFGRAWMLPMPGTEVSVLRYIASESGQVRSIIAPLRVLSGARYFGGMLQVPEGPLLAWGFSENRRGEYIDWVAELTPPMFDDEAWQDAETFESVGLGWRRQTRRELSRQIHNGTITLTYDAIRELLIFRDRSVEKAWVARPEMSQWVDEDNWRFLFLREDPIRWRHVPLARPGEPRIGLARPLPAGWPGGFVRHLRDRPTLRLGQLDPERRTDPLVESILEDLLEVEVDEPVHVCARCDHAWVLGLDNGMVVHTDLASGQFRYAAQVRGIPVTIDLVTEVADERRQTMSVVYWSSDEDETEPRRSVFELGLNGWTRLSDESMGAGLSLPWTSRRVVELYNDLDEPSEVVWTDAITHEEIETIGPDDGLHLVGLLSLPDGRVLGYGTDRQADNDAPLLIDVTRGRKGIVWHRDYGFYAEQDPLPETGFTRAAYVPEAQRILLVADGKVWSCDRWLSDWRQELPGLPAGWGEEEEDGDDVEE